ncbi:ProQ/FINO family protein [Parachitinimonas caeni]|uniref:ProQ/FINO family protein n=1 Tax=Parachitinimonas caeni TaxID=3031301 RepID=A0ABT7E329_9NEIS|nr:ProQ/FINO family protein [Parachitinimonas caeni]MDK2126703.1 ProQ/FINO family protein [Parachitinimonas caeni]
MDKDTLQRLLVERWPSLFDRSPIAPLDINIHQKIRTALGLDEAGLASLVALLGELTREAAYRQQIAAGGRRVRLDGSAGTTIRPWDIAAAKDALEGGDAHRQAFRQQRKAWKLRKQAAEAAVAGAPAVPESTHPASSTPARPVLKLAVATAKA